MGAPTQFGICPAVPTTVPARGSICPVALTPMPPSVSGPMERLARKSLAERSAVCMSGVS